MNGGRESGWVPHDTPSEHGVMIRSEPSGFRAPSSPRDDGDDAPILIVPGLYNSGPDHWQSHWQRDLPGAERVDQTDWERPALGDWTISLA